MGAQVWGIAMVRDEVDVIADTLRHMLDEVDYVLVADNGSTDGTLSRLEMIRQAYRNRIVVERDPDPAYYQSAKMSALASRAAARGADWIVPFDADELWYSTEERLSVVLRAAAERGERVVEARLFNHYCTAIDPVPEARNAFAHMPWRARDPLPLRKVAFRYEHGAVIHQGNHGVTLPSSANGRLSMGNDGVTVRHFPYRSVEQFVRKARNGAAAYRATTLPESEGAHWRAYGAILDRLGEDGLGDVFREHFWYLSPTDSGLVLDPAPFRRWQQ